MPFNVITGDMGSGKSLCIKLLYFFEEIFVSSILLSPRFSKEFFEDGNFFEQLSENFKKIFYLNGNKWHGLKITYSFQANGSNFTISLNWDDTKNELLWECDYLKKNMGKWSGYFNFPDTPDMSMEVTKRIHREITHDFLDKLPISTFFVPASRAALSVVGSNTPFKDHFLNEFARSKDFLLSRFDTNLNGKLADILKVKSVQKNPNDVGDVCLEHKDGRVVPSLFSSSGQQELVYLLLLMEKMPEIKFIYGRMLSVFIEEPSAHLFPKEQKELIENIVALFRREKKIETRFFITTHSPYVLNVINNMLKKSSIRKKHPEKAEEIDKKIDFPHLCVEEVSAIFINEYGKTVDMFNPDNEEKVDNDDKDIILADRIQAISKLINDDIQELFDLEEELNGNS